MTIRLGRVVRGMLESVLDLQARPVAFTSKGLGLFAHEYRKPLKEMRKARDLQHKPRESPSLLTTLLNAPRGEPLDMPRSPRAKGES